MTRSRWTAAAGQHPAWSRRRWSDPDEDRDEGWNPDDADARRVGSHQPLRAKWDPTSRDVGIAPDPPSERQACKQSKLGKFVAVYGWRAYAIPILLVVTVLVLVDAVRGGVVTDQTAAVDPGFGARSTSTDGTDVIGVPPKADGNFAESIPSGSLPEGGPFTVTGAGTWHVVPGTRDQVGHGAGKRSSPTRSRSRTASTPPVSVVTSPSD